MGRLFFENTLAAKKIRTPSLRLNCGFYIANEWLCGAVFYSTTDTRFTLMPFSELMRIRYMPVPYCDRLRTV